MTHLLHTTKIIQASSIFIKNNQFFASPLSLTFDQLSCRVSTDGVSRPVAAMSTGATRQAAAMSMYGERRRCTAVLQLDKGVVRSEILAMLEKDIGK